MSNKHEIDMCSGNLLPKIIRYSIPLMLASILQLLYNAVDIIVVGRFVGSAELAAVGSTSSLINLTINAFVGLSIGSSIILGQSIGARNFEKTHRIIHTAMTASVFIGIALGIFGFFACRPLLELMDSPEDVIDQATVYLKIYFLGMPGFMVYTFGSAILRTVGDTKRPLFFLTVSGCANVLLNLVLVLIFRKGVEGVAIGTIASQYISAVLVVITLLKYDGVCHLEPKKIKIHWGTFFQTIKLGVPIAIQMSMFSFSNVLVQSSVNSFGSDVVAGNAAAANIESFLHAALNAFGQTALAFAAQNYGAKNYKRVTKTVLICSVVPALIGLAVFPLFLAFGKSLLHIYLPDNPVAIDKGFIRFLYVSSTYCIFAIMNSVSYGIRATGFAFLSMCISIIGICGIRISWILFIFPQIGTLGSLYIAYFVSWSITAIAFIITYLYIRKTKFQ